MLFIDKIVLTRMYDNKQTYSMYITIKNLDDKIKRN